MRRVTWMVRLHQCDKRDGFLKISWVPMQRTNYYMPWGTVTVDELHRMEFSENDTIVLAYDEETHKWQA